MKHKKGEEIPILSWIFYRKIQGFISTYRFRVSQTASMSFFHK